ncbi:MAG: hypothetical protein O7D91_01665 [Planctomycetota bacterium]|nr:hypothetical protein [Planctomycetota bacterium]
MTLDDGKLPDRTRHMTPLETPADEARNANQAAEQELERLRSRLESSLEVALTGLSERDYIGVASELEGVENMAAHLAESDESPQDPAEQCDGARTRNAGAES